MTKHFAIPLRDDGTERPGTLGMLVRPTLVGIRRAIKRYGAAGTTYVIYRRNGNDGSWSQILETITKETAER